VYHETLVSEVSRCEGGKTRNAFAAECVTRLEVRIIAMQKVDSSLQGIECKREQKLADFEWLYFRRFKYNCFPFATMEQ
jgi:hypothetical protein